MITVEKTRRSSVRMAGGTSLLVFCTRSSIARLFLAQRNGMAFRNSEDAVVSATQAIFGKWMALQLTLENHPDRSKCETKARQLYEQTVQMMTSASKTHDVDDLIELFYAAFDDMNTDVEDGSPEQVAGLIVGVRNAAARGDYGPATRATQGTGRNAQLQTRNVVEERVNEEDDGAVDSGSNPGSHSDMMDVEPRKAPFVDEDGFTAVVRKGRR